jgi:glutathione-specific gamma-glutamylcyclotransferase
MDTDLHHAHQSMPADGEAGAWIFGYGSLLWRQGFAYEEVRDARLLGWHRSLCVYSWVHRGTPERPGLVLGLDRGGSCRGRIFRVTPEREAEVLAYLDGRELVTEVYHRKRLPVATAEGRLPAWCYVVRREHAQYAGRLDPARLLALIRQGEGISGACRDYLTSTVDHLEAMGIVDGPLHDLARSLRGG